MVAEAGIPLTHQLMVPSAKNSLVCCWNHCTTVAFMSVSNPNLWPISAFLRRPNSWKSHGDIFGLYGRVQHLPVHGVQFVLDSGHMGRSTVMRHNDTPSEHARMFSFDDFVRVLKHQHQWSIHVEEESCLNGFCTWNDGI